MTGFGHSHDDIRVEPMKRRFLVIITYCCYVVANQFQYVGNAYIIDELSDYLDTSKTAVNLLAAVYAVIYVFLAFPSCEVFARMGLKTTLVIGLGINFLGALIKFISILWVRQFWFFVIGQIFAGVAQLFCIAAPPLLAASWFPIEERSVATAIGTLSGFLGMALGFGIAPAIITDDHKGPLQFNLLYGGQAVWCLVNLLVCIFFIPAHPEHPPSITSPRYIAIKKERDSQARLSAATMSSSPSGTSANLLNDEGEAASVAVEPHIPPHVFKQVWAQRHNTSLIIVVATFGIGGGSLTAVSAVLSQILQPYNVDEGESGTITLVAILCGCVACVISGPLMDKYRRYRKPLIWLDIVLVFALLTMVFCMAGIHVSGGIFVPVAYFGIIWVVIALLPALPISLELAVELTYPLDETIPSTACFWSNGFCAMIGTVAVTILVGDEASKSDGLIIIGVVAVLVMLCIVLLCLFVKEDLKRLQREIEEKQAHIAIAAPERIW